MAEPRKLYRSRSHRQVAGVCVGLAQYFNPDLLGCPPAGYRPSPTVPARAGGWWLEGLDVQRRATTQVRLLVPLTAGDDRS